MEERFDRGWWVGEEWCPRDPKVSAVPRGKCRVLRRNATGLGIVEVRDRQVKGLSVRALRGKVRLSNRSGVTGKGGLSNRSGVTGKGKVIYPFKTRGTYGGQKCAGVDALLVKWGK